MQEEKYGINTKKYMFNELKKKLDASLNFVITNYKGLTSPEIEALRRQLGRTSSKYFVVKNSIIKRAFDECDLGDMAQYINGEVGIGFVGDIIAASKTLVDFAKEHKSFKLNCAFIDGKIEGMDRITQLAKLPPRDVLLSLALTYMKSPITDLVGVLKGLLRNLAYAINEIKNKKEEGEKK